MTCARHPDVETGLTCNHCGVAICPDCLVPGAVGMLCLKCGKRGLAKGEQIAPLRLALSLVAGLAAGTMVGLLLQFVGFFLCFIAPLLGGLLGDVVLRLTGHKVGRVVEAIVGISLFGGAAIAAVVMGGGLLYRPVSLAFFVIALILAAGAAFARVRR